MSRDHSLDDFRDAVAGGDTGERDADPSATGAPPTTDGADGADGVSDADATDDADGASGADGSCESPDAGDVAPAEPTRAWSADGDACAACGRTATTRWRQDGGYVCPDCKEW